MISIKNDNRQRIAQLCGWSEIKFEDFSKDGVPCFILMGKSPEGIRLAVPDYYTDLNALHIAEKTLTPAQQYTYSDLLWKITGRSKIFKSINASAEDRCKAFLML